MIEVRDLQSFWSFNIKILGFNNSNICLHIANEISNEINVPVRGLFLSSLHSKRNEVESTKS